MRTDDSRPAEWVRGGRHLSGGYAVAVLLALVRAARGHGRATPVETALPRSRSPRASRILVAFDLLIAAVVLAGLWIEYSGGFEYQIGQISLSATSTRGPFRIAVGLAFLRLWLTDAWGSRQIEQSLVALSFAPRASRVFALAAGLVVIGCLGHGVEALGQGKSQILGGASAPRIRADSHHQHLTPLIQQIVGREGGGAIAVAIDDINPRGHLAAYYCYPRVLLMSLERARWCMTSRMTDARKLGPGDRGSAAASALADDADWAQARGVRFFAASRARAVELGAEPRAPGPESR